MSIKAIETRYAGCRFRSRLEARWAIYFNDLGIRWEYEPQGFTCERRLTHEGAPRLYLPDFYLPDHGVYAEVKGHWATWQDAVDFADCAAYLSSGGLGGCGYDNTERGARDVLLLGAITEELLPARLHFHKGELWAERHDFARPSESSCPAETAFLVGDDSGWVDAAQLAEVLTGLPPYLQTSSLHRRGAVAARSARFEHGERG